MMSNDDDDLAEAIFQQVQMHVEFFLIGFLDLKAASYLWIDNYDRLLIDASAEAVVKFDMCLNYACINFY